MKFFKHFCDSRHGRSMTALMNQFGLEGYAAYFILIEMCAEKLEKPEDGELTVDHCKFIFNERVVREKLRMRSTKVELFLNSCAALDLLLFTKDKEEFNFSIPNLLKYLDRDSKRARSIRALSASKIKKKIEDKEEDIRAPKFDFDAAFKLSGLRAQGPEAKERFDHFIKTEADYADLIAAIGHYKKVLEIETWRAPKTSFAIFLGAKKKPFYRDYISPDSCLPLSPTSPSSQNMLVQK